MLFQVKVNASTAHAKGSAFQLTNLSILRFSLDANRSIFKLIPNF